MHFCQRSIWAKEFRACSIHFFSKMSKRMIVIYSICNMRFVSDVNGMALLYGGRCPLNIRKKPSRSQLICWIWSWYSVCIYVQSFNIYYCIRDGLLTLWIRTKSYIRHVATIRLFHAGACTQFLPEEIWRTIRRDRMGVGSRASVTMYTSNSKQPCTLNKSIVTLLGTYPQSLH